MPETWGILMKFRLAVDASYVFEKPRLIHVNLNTKPDTATCSSPDNLPVSDMKIEKIHQEPQNAYS